MNNNDYFNDLNSNLQIIVSECVSYVNNASSVVRIYMYVSFESAIFFDFFYEFDKEVLKRHEINKILENADISIERQKDVVDYIHVELQNMKQTFVNYKQEVPTQIKAIYFQDKGKATLKLNYEKHHKDELFIGDDEVANEWFEELKREIDTRSCL